MPRQRKLVGPDGKILAEAVFNRPEFIPGGWLLPLAGGDVLAFTFCRISDSGVQIMRVNSQSGAILWSAYCPTLRMSHSEYSHEAHALVNVAANRAAVMSGDDGGRFVELLDLTSGQRIVRWRFD